MSKGFALLLGLLLAHSVCAAELFGTVEAVSGEATLTDGTGASKPVAAGLKVFSGQSIQTAADGEVHIVTEDSGFIALRPNSSFRSERYQAKGEPSDAIVFSLFRGALRSITGWIAKQNAAAYRLHTPNATIGVRGTDHETAVLKDRQGEDLPGTFASVYEGITVMQGAQGEIELHPGEHGFTPGDGAGRPRMLSQRPAFLQQRSLHLESRIQQRKELLLQNMQHRLQERLSASQEAVGDHKPSPLDRRDAVKKKIEQKYHELRKP